MNSFRFPVNQKLSIELICSLQNLTALDMVNMDLDRHSLEDFPFYEPTIKYPFVFKSFQKLVSLRLDNCFPEFFVKNLGQNMTLLSHLTHLQGQLPYEVKFLTQLRSIKFSSKIQSIARTDQPIWVNKKIWRKGPVLKSPCQLKISTCLHFLLAQIG